MVNLEKLRPILGHPSWPLFEEYLREQRKCYVDRLIAEKDTAAADTHRGRIRQLDTLLSLAPSVLKKPKL